MARQSIGYQPLVVFVNHSFNAIIKEAMDRLIQIPESKLDELINAVEQLKDQESKMDTIQSIEQLLWSIQVSSIMPLSEQYEAMAQELASREGKQIEWESAGFDLELPEKNRELVQNVLLHGVRNAIDHGIETTGERVVSGKPEAGRIRASVEIIATSLVIRVVDDGRGPDVEKIAKHAVEKSLVSETLLPKMSEEEKLELVFRPGFSTKAEVDEMSGLGVGLEAIKAMTSKMSGKASVHKGASGGFMLSVVTPVEVIGVKAAKIKVGSEYFWLRDGYFKIVEETLSDEDKEKAFTFSKLINQKLSETPRFILLKIASKNIFVAVDEVGLGEPKLFRCIDESFKHLGSGLYQNCFDAGNGRVLATKTDNGLELFLDRVVLAKLIDRAVTAST